MTQEELKHVRITLNVCEQMIGQMPFTQAEKVMLGIRQSAVILEQEAKQEPNKQKGGEHE